MGWVEELAGQLVGLDSAPLIYYIEADATYVPLVDPFFEAVSRRALRVVTSTVTLVEVLSQQLGQGDTALAARYRRILLTSQGVLLQAVSVAIAEEGARLRALRGLRTPDAIQLATARLAGARSCLTNDGALAAVPDIEVLVLNRLRGFA